MEVYIDEILVKSLIAEHHLAHLCQAFEVLERYNMKLNPTKCSFGVFYGKFIGYMVTQHGIEANLDQIKFLMGIPSPTYIKDAQRLARRVATFNRFISRSSKKCHLFFTTLRKSKDFSL